jgi:integrative and conjugative element protein (TIGR02256 family)
MPMNLIIPTAIMETCSSDAIAHAPLETGGLFLGRMLENDAVQVEHMVGAGPKARRSPTWLDVDHNWQNDRIAELYAEGYRGGYIGEWHTHPAATNAIPSSIDRVTLKKLANFTPLRCPNPIMMILHPFKTGWEAGAWRLVGSASWLRSHSRARIEKVPVLRAI